MAWPVSQDYNEAIQNPQSSFGDPELRGGEATTNALGMPMPRSGNFADVYEFNSPATNSKWAIKCFTRQVPGLSERYAEISASLSGAKLPFAVEFQYLEQGMRLRGEWYPILKMRWVEGMLLNELVRENLEKPAVLGQLGQIWARMAKRLRESSLAHADLQHGNVILIPGSKAGSLAVKLIDYDGMFVPALARKKSGEVGHPNYQHPQRLRDGTYSAEVDRFPLLVVATSLKALSIAGRELWDRYDNSDNLLFRESDLQAPGKSALFTELHKLPDPQMKMLAEALHKAAEGKLDAVPTLEDLLAEPTKPKTKVQLAPATPAPAAVKEPEVVEVEPISEAPVVAEEEAPAPKSKRKVEAEAEEEESLEDIDAARPTKSKRKDAEPKRGIPTWAWAAGGAGVLAVGGIAAVVIAIVATMATRGDPKKDGPIVQRPDDAVKEKGKGPPKIVTGDGNKEGKKDKGVDPPLVPVVAKGRTIELIPLVDPKLDAVNNRKWAVRNGTLCCDDRQFGPRLQLPYQPPEEYDFTAVFSQPSLRNPISLIMPNPNGGSFVWYVGGEMGTYGFLANPRKEGQIPGIVQANVQCTTTVQVRKNSVKGFVNGKEIIAVNTDYRDLMSDQWRDIPDKSLIAVCCDDPTVYQSVRVVEVSGPGKVTRQPQAIVANPNFVPLFNGVDFTGWKIGKDDPRWKVDDGILKGIPLQIKSMPSAELASVRNDYTDFHLRAEVRSFGGDARLIFRRGDGFVGLETTIGKQAVGGMFTRTRDPNGDSNSYRLSNTGKQVPVPEGQWVSVEIIAKGTTVEISVNGTNSVHHQGGPTFPQSGAIVLHRAADTVLEVRKLEIKDLKGAPADGPFALKGKAAPTFITDIKGIGDTRLSADGKYIVAPVAAVARMQVREGPDFAKPVGTQFGGALSGVNPYVSFPDGKCMTLAAKFNEGPKVIVWDLDGKRPKTMLPTPELANTVAVSADMNYLAAYCTEPVPNAGHWVVLFNLNTKKEVGRWQARGPVLAFSSDSKKLFYSPGAGQPFECRNVADGSPVTTSLQSSMRHAFSSDYRFFASLDNRQRQIQIRNMDNGAQVAVIDTPDPKILFNACAFSMDGEHLLVAFDDMVNRPNQNGRVALYKIKTGEMISVSEPFPEAPRHVQIGSNGIVLADNRIYRFPTSGTGGPPDVPLPVAAPGFVPLFDGKTLTGWKLSKDSTTWQVKDGILRGEGKDLVKLFTERDDYTDFHLRVEARISDRGMGTLSFRSKNEPNQPNFGYHARINSNNPDQNKTGSLAFITPSNTQYMAWPKSVTSPNTWFTLEVIALKEDVAILVDGKRFNAFRSGQPLLAKGRFQLAVDEQSVLEIRKIDVKDVSDKAPVEIVTTPGFTPLFDGKTLNGWKLSNQNQNFAQSWQVKDGLLRSSSADVCDLYTDRNDYEDFHLRAEARVNDRGWSAIVCRAPLVAGEPNFVEVGYHAQINCTALNPSRTGSLWVRAPAGAMNYSQKEALASPGEWHTLEFIAKGNHITVMVNGKVTQDLRDSTSAKGRIYLRGSKLPSLVEIRRLEIKEFGKGAEIAKQKDPPPIKGVRTPVPEPGQVAQAEKTIRDQFKAEYAKKANADQIALAEKLLKLSKDTADNPTDYYTLLREARTISSKAGSVDLALKATADLIEKYDIDEAATKVETLVALSKGALNVEGTKRLVDAAMTQASLAIAEDHFEMAGKAIEAAEAALARNKNGVLLATVQKQEKLIKEYAKEHADVKKAQEKLMTDANDAASNLLVGSYYAFRKGDWDKAMPMFAVCGQADLQNLAKKELAAPADDKARLELAEGWWDGADKKSGNQKSAMQWRAAHWYREALPNMTGLARTRAADRVKLVDAQPSPFRSATAMGEVDRFKGHQGTVMFLTLARDGKRLWSCGTDGTVREWVVSTGKGRVVLGPQISKGPLAQFCLAPDEKMIALLGVNGKLSVVELPSLAYTKYGKSERDAVPGLRWDNGRITYNISKDWHMWDSVRGGGNSSMLLPQPVPPYLSGLNVRGMVYGADHEIWAAFFEGATFVFGWNANSQFRGGIRFEATTAAFPKDNKMVCLANATGTVRIYKSPTFRDEATKAELNWKGHSGVVRCAAFTTDGRLVTGGDDKMLKVWDATNGRELTRFLHPGSVTAVVITPDNRYAITACADGSIRVWALTKTTASVKAP